MFVEMYVLDGDDLCSSSLERLVTRLEAREKIRLSCQALDKHFNTNAVAFLKNIFERLLYEHVTHQISSCIVDELPFSAIKIVDSSIIQLSQNLATTYQGTGGDSSKAALEMQLEYELLSAKFISFHLDHGRSSDISYLSYIDQKIVKNALYLKDLGYFKIDALKNIDTQGGFYITKLKAGSSIYRKDLNPPLKHDGTVSKSKMCKKIDIHSIAEGQTISYMDTYVSLNKLKSRFISTKLTEECKENRVKKYKLNVRKRKKKVYDKDNLSNSINTYITNIPPEIASDEQIHKLYTLRWQIQNIFKICKSIFHMDVVKKVKLERFQCFLYGRLIEFLLTASMVEVCEMIKTSKKQGFISEMQAFSKAKEYLKHLIGKKNQISKLIN